MIFRFSYSNDTIDLDGRNFEIQNFYEAATDYLKTISTIVKNIETCFDNISKSRAWNGSS